MAVHVMKIIQTVSNIRTCNIGRFRILGGQGLEYWGGGGGGGARAATFPAGT